MHPIVRPARGEHSALRVAASNCAKSGEVRAAAPVNSQTAEAQLLDRAAYWKQPSRHRRGSQNILLQEVEHTHSRQECVKPLILKPECESKELAPWGAIHGPRLRYGRRCRSVGAAALGPDDQLE